MVETVDAVDGLPEEEARTLSKRMWYLGWFGLPLMWFVNAYYFWPHLADHDDDVGLSAGRIVTRHSRVLDLLHGPHWLPRIRVLVVTPGVRLVTGTILADIN